jgi:hypothetical protein
LIGIWLLVSLVKPMQKKTMARFYCLKWGSKYSHVYVNRLYNSLKKHYHKGFDMHCLTDNSVGINPEINIEPIPTEWEHYPRTQIFTSEKMCYFNDQRAWIKGPKAWFDLDILIQADITKLIDAPKEKVTFIWNYWRDDQAAVDNYDRMTTPINSSFVAWQDDLGNDMYHRLKKNQAKAFFTYPSFDKYLFYQEHRKGNIDFWPRGIVYNYNIGVEYPLELVPQKYQDHYIVCLFNTSHKKWARPNETNLELHEAKGWAKTMWDSYSDRTPAETFYEVWEKYEKRV